MKTETKAQHTPGPWKAEDRPSDKREHWYIRAGVGISSPFGIAVAMIPKSAGKLSELDANARLIAAAPIGYELAEAIINQATDGMDRSEWILRKAEEFMAKVEGRKP